MIVQWIIAGIMLLVCCAALTVALRLYLLGEWNTYLDEYQQEGDDYTNAYEDTAVHQAFFPGSLSGGSTNHRGGSSEGKQGGGL